MSLRIFAGIFKGRALSSPKTKKTRPTQGIVRQAVFNMLQGELHNAHFLDVFAGSGAMGFEAASQGASFCTFIEQDRVAARALEESRVNLGIQAQSEVLVSDLFIALKRLQKRGKCYNIVYIDPPYKEAATLVPKVLSELESLGLLAKSACVFVEVSATEPAFAHPSEGFVLVDMRTFGGTRLVRYAFCNNLA